MRSSLRQKQRHSSTPRFPALGLEAVQTQSQTVHRDFSRFDASVKFPAFAIDQEAHGGIALPDAVHALGTSRVVYHANKSHAQLRWGVPRHHRATAAERESPTQFDLERRGWGRQRQRSEQTNQGDTKFHRCILDNLDVWFALNCSSHFYEVVSNEPLEKVTWTDSRVSSTRGTSLSPKGQLPLRRELRGKTYIMHNKPHRRGGRAKRGGSARPASLHSKSHLIKSRAFANWTA
jgi:hypothetical protein